MLIANGLGLNRDSPRPVSCVRGHRISDSHTRAWLSDTCACNNVLLSP